MKKDFKSKDTALKNGITTDNALIRSQISDLLGKIIARYYLRELTATKSPPK
jgi:hypothetical protein